MDREEIRNRASKFAIVGNVILIILNSAVGFIKWI
jgi:hypothetical protein